MCFNSPARANARNRGPGTAVSPSKRVGVGGLQGNLEEGGPVIGPSDIRGQDKMGVQKLKREQVVVTKRKASFVFGSHSVKKMGTCRDWRWKRNSGYFD